jgi:hypothetical protein
LRRLVPVSFAFYLVYVSAKRRNNLMLSPAVVRNSLTARNLRSDPDLGNFARLTHQRRYLNERQSVSKPTEIARGGEHEESGWRTGSLAHHWQQPERIRTSHLVGVPVPSTFRVPRSRTDRTSACCPPSGSRFPSYHPVCRADGPPKPVPTCRPWLWRLPDARHRAGASEGGGFFSVSAANLGEPPSGSGAVGLSSGATRPARRLGVAHLGDQPDPGRQHGTARSTSP